MSVIYINSYQFGAALWTPAEIATAVWLDGADVNTITQNGGLVSQWSDKSGNSRHFIQSVEVDRPTFQASGGPNNLSYVAFNSDFMEAQAAWVNYVNGLNIVSVFRNRTSNTSILCANREASALPETRLQSAIIPSANTMFYRIFGSSTGEAWIGRVAPILPINSWATLGMLYNGGTTSADVSIYRNAQQVDTTNDQNGSFVKQSSTSTTPFMLGAQGSGGQRITGDYAELIILQSALSVSDRQKLEGYLAHKWGLTGNLPAAHPYKTAAPTV